MLPRHGQHARSLVRGEGVRGDQLAVVARLVNHGLMRARDDIVIGADRLEHAQPILPDKDAGAERTQLRACLVDTHRPAALGKRNGSGESRETSARDFSVTLCGHVRYGDLAKHRRSADEQSDIRVCPAHR